ncbi:MAG: hypothetical protein ACRCVN_05955 [Spirochaetia bacterium]
MNIWPFFKEQIEKQTGLKVTYFKPGQTIAEREIIIMISSVFRNENKSYEIEGEFVLKEGEVGLKVMTDLLDAELTGTRQQARLTQYGNGFVGMAVDFAILIHPDELRITAVKEIVLHD